MEMGWFARGDGVYGVVRYVCIVLTLVFKVPDKVRYYYYHCIDTVIATHPMVVRPSSVIQKNVLQAATKLKESSGWRARSAIFFKNKFQDIVYSITSSLWWKVETGNVPTKNKATKQKSNIGIYLAHLGHCSVLISW